MNGNEKSNEILTSSIDSFKVVELLLIISYIKK